jgi:hypothetical protein
LGFQPFDDLSGNLLFRRTPGPVKVGQYFIQTMKLDLSTIGKMQLASTNCRRFGLASGHSADYFKGRQGHLLYFLSPQTAVCGFAHPDLFDLAEEDRGMSRFQDLGQVIKGLTAK